EWTQAMDQQRNLRLRSDVELRSMLEQRGITSDKTVVVYCQTHHRSAHTFIALKAIGYEKIKGYPGSWSDWGNQEDTPIELA
ncbi:MAG: sulfurtransferase, partial [Gammaproteobacteria bacterium]|nr:sulfurtransferase [Gammaproteobacteria bacterium]